MAGGFLQSALEQLFKIIFMPGLNKLAKEMDNDKEVQDTLQKIRQNARKLDYVISDYCRRNPNAPICIKRKADIETTTARISNPYKKRVK